MWNHAVWTRLSQHSCINQLVSFPLHVQDACTVGKTLTCLRLSLVVVTGRCGRLCCQLLTAFWVFIFIVMYEGISLYIRNVSSTPLSQQQTILCEWPMRIPTPCTRAVTTSMTPCETLFVRHSQTLAGTGDRHSCQLGSGRTSGVRLTDTQYAC